jgi:hypothetical protein
LPTFTATRTNFSIFQSHMLLHILRQCTDILKTYSSRNSSQSIFIYVLMYLCMCIINVYIITLKTCYIILLIFYSYVWLLWCSFFLYYFKQFASIHYKIDFSLYSTSIPTVFNYMCVCVCVCECAGKRKVLLLSSVMSAVSVSSKNCLEY